MAGEERPGGTGRQGPERRLAAARDDDLERRRRDLEASLASRLPDGPEGEDGRGKGGRSSGYAQAFKLSSEFIAGIAVGIGIGWFIDRMAGTSPWGLIVFLLLGFGAGILNVLRSAGLVADFGQGEKPRPKK